MCPPPPGWDRVKGSTFDEQQPQLSTPNTPDCTAHHESGQWERQSSPLAYHSSTPFTLNFTGIPRICTKGKATSHVRMLAPRIILPIFRRTMRQHSERSHKLVTKPCSYNNSTSYTFNSLTHYASTQRERLQSPVLTTPRLPLSILRSTLRPHSEKGHKVMY